MVATACVDLGCLVVTLVEMGTGVLPADTGFTCPRLRPKSYARVRALHPPRVANHARARYPQIAHARGHACVPASSKPSLLLDGAASSLQAVRDGGGRR
jgi:hypothetical protein